jgi:hypothetical protein
MNSAILFSQPGISKLRSLAGDCGLANGSMQHPVLLPRDGPAGWRILALAVAMARCYFPTMEAKPGLFLRGIAVPGEIAGPALHRRKTQNLREQEEGAKLTCPVCGDTAVTFHSETSVPIAGTAEQSAIFVCSASHAFIVPYRTLDQL